MNSALVSNSTPPHLAVGCLSEAARLSEDALRLHASFAHWPEGALQRLLAIAQLKSYPKDAWIYDNSQECPDVLIIVSGFLQIYRHTTDQRLQAVGIVGSGRIVSMTYDFAPGSWFPLSCWAHSDALVIHVQKQLLAGLLDAVPELWRLLGMALLSQQRELLEALVDQSRGGAPQRLASLLYRYSLLHEVSPQCDDGVPRKVPLSQTQLADLLQLSRQTVNEVLRTFSDEGWIRIGYKSIVILDPTALLQYSGGRLTADMSHARPGLTSPSDGRAPFCIQPMP